MLPTLCDFPGGKPRRYGVLHKGETDSGESPLDILQILTFDRYKRGLPYSFWLHLESISMSSKISLLPTRLCQHMFFQ